MSTWRRMFWLMSEVPLLVFAWEAAKPRLEELAKTDPTVAMLHKHMDRIWKVVRLGIKPKYL